MEDQQREIAINTRTILRIIAIIFGVLAIIYFRKILVLFLAGIIFSAASDGPIRLLMRRRLPRFGAAVVLYLLVILIVLLIFSLILPIFINQLKEFIVLLGDFLKTYFDIELTPAEAFRALILRAFSPSDALAGAVQVFNITSGLLGGLISVIIVFVISFYLSLREGQVEALFEFLIPERFDDYALSLWKRAQRKVSQWFAGQIWLSLIVGLAVYLGLMFLGIPYALLVGVFAAVLEIVPIVGPIVAGTFGVLVSLNQDPFLIFAVVVLFVVIQQLENHLIVPVVMRRAIGLSPVLIIFSLLIAGQILGFWGVLVAIPLTAVLAEFINDYRSGRIKAVLKEV